ncbi:hypothetical protein HK102_010727, partial [Quaeritorhiza haematococci]
MVAKPIVLPDPAAPMVLSDPPSTRTPWPTVAEAPPSVLPRIWLSSDRIRIAAPAKLRIVRSWIVLPPEPAASVNPSSVPPPSIVTSVRPVTLTTTGPVIESRSVDSTMAEA